MKITVQMGRRVQDGEIVARIVKTPGKSKSLRVKTLSGKIATLLKQALASRLDEGDWACEFEFWIEPRSVSGAGEKKEGRAWVQFRRRNGCSAAVADIGMAVYQVILDACMVKEGDEV